ncbi:MAG: type IIA DNA topoisomerase subunit B [Lentisphaeria bacterium]|nr:type IIA DNA topoisomerase subunit B [Lentisphaeria bacterium]
MAKKGVEYDDSAIKTLKSLEHIRLRPGMYIGRMGNGNNPEDGIYIMIKEVIDNCIDEFIMGNGNKVDISLDEECVTIRDYGRGIPLGKIVECVSEINTGAKFNDDVFQFSVGLNGVGTKAVNALSEWFQVTSHRDGKFASATFEGGILVDQKKGKTTEENGTEVSFIPDRNLYPKYKFSTSFIRKRMWNYAYLNSGLTIRFNDEKIFSRNGLYDMLNDKVDGDNMYDIIHHKERMLEFALTHTADFGENYFSFVNGQYTNDGGTHQSAFKEGILKAFNSYTGKSYDGSDVRNGIYGVISIKLKDPIFESQTKNKLGNGEIRGEIVNQVKDIIEKFLHKNQSLAEVMLEKVEQNAAVRKQVQAVRKASREKAKKVALKIPKLKDCKYHLGDKKPKSRGDESMIFIAEGDSAVGPMISARDVHTQAIFPLKGKPLNCYGKKRDLVVSNDEFYCLMRALNIEDGIEDLRYQKVILATDADDDGMHIRNLLLTFFLYYFKELILSNHLFILETPLYRVRNKKETLYCYDDDELAEASKKLGKMAEITRFKGLGEIDPREFGQFIGDDMRLIPVEIEKIHEVPELLNFFMGANTPARRDFIVNNLL